MIVVRNAIGKKADYNTIYSQLLCNAPFPLAVLFLRCNQNEAIMKIRRNIQNGETGLRSILSDIDIVLLIGKITVCICCLHIINLINFVSWQGTFGPGLKRFFLWIIMILLWIIMERFRWRLNCSRRHLSRYKSSKQSTN